MDQGCGVIDPATKRGSPIGLPQEITSRLLGQHHGINDVNHPVSTLDVGLGHIGVIHHDFAILDHDRHLRTLTVGETPPMVRQLSAR